MPRETAIFARGCFWCTEAVFHSLAGVTDRETPRPRKLTDAAGRPHYGEGRLSRDRTRGRDHGCGANGRPAAAPGADRRTAALGIGGRASDFEDIPFSPDKDRRHDP